MRMGGDRPYDPAEASHLALRAIQRELERHPLVARVEGFPDGEFTQLVAHLAANRLGMDPDTATLTIRWYAGETPEARPQFSFHYSDDTTDFGWHHEPNPHVDGWGHFQERNEDRSTYSYEPYRFGSAHPTRIAWEIMSLLFADLDSE